MGFVKRHKWGFVLIPGIVLVNIILALTVFPDTAIWSIVWGIWVALSGIAVGVLAAILDHEERMKQWK